MGLAGRPVTPWVSQLQPSHKPIPPSRTHSPGAVPSSSVVAYYEQERAWLGRLQNLSGRAATLLAGHAAGCLTALPGLGSAGRDTQDIFSVLERSAPSPASLAHAWSVLSGVQHGEALTAQELACIEALWPIAVPTACLLASGGDERLTLDPVTGLNRYGCAPWPRETVISFGSCTASSLSAGAFAAAEQARRALAAASLAAAPSVALAAASDAIGAALVEYFQVADLAEAVLAASGTDAALVVTGLLAAERPGEALTSIVMSPSETGSGVPDAVQGRHFASSAAAGCKVGKGEPIEGLTHFPPLATVALRDRTGAPRCPADIGAACEAAVRDGAARGHVVLHAIDGSKTGLTAPDRATCRRLSDRFAGRLDIVVDACQARIEPALVRWYLQQGFPVLVTGSKFFAAPGFCGAVLFPRDRLRRIARHGRLPAGLAPYARLEGGFGSRRCAGLVLRWHAALHEMHAFAGLTAVQIRQRLNGIGQAVTAGLADDPRLALAQAPRPDGSGWSDRPSVFTFMVRSAGNWMTPSQLRRVYEAMGDDISAELPSVHRLAAQSCQIGQPVELGTPSLGGLRIAISAAQIVSGNDQRAELAMVLGKLGLLLDRAPSLPLLDAAGPDAAGPKQFPDAATLHSARLTG